MTEREKSFMKMAIELSQSGMDAGKGGPFGCIVVKDDEVIGMGSNSVSSTNDPTAHAEVVAIRDACQNLKNFQLDGCEIYTSCEPCPMCLGAIYWARPARVFYANTKRDAANAGFDDQFIYEELDLPLNERSIPFEQLLNNDAKVVFDNWKKKENKTLY
ncbi:tRNA(Arg) A34 adenosine deaminase TadA [Belliella buryatensis]|uniref:tRNA(Arg) A34 adenosine deaminase TadA n=1 Tax=Belliella buryatensis TaxID=1500549 RepID=A0A239AUJ7_9BACT|nr:nucleoside deaminase [Belliella buryatensis]SNR98638.1 tRNA(Arg) A34 adenosine deaminase TadA [Belliella buryatensis]